MQANWRCVGMSWEPELTNCAARQELAQEMGGAEKIARQHQAGKLTVRERIDTLLDPAVFHEVGAITGNARYDERAASPASRPRTSSLAAGRIDGRRVVVAGDDFTVRGGATDAAISEKRSHARADGARAAHADRAAGRRHRRRRLGQDHRELERHATFRPTRAGTSCVRQPRDGAGRRRWPRPGRRPRRSARRRQPLLGDGEGHGADVRRRARRSWPGSARADQERARRQRDPHRATARSTTKPRARQEAFADARGVSSRTCRPRCTSCPPRRRPTTTRSAATNG